jgi:hypothetical protein
VSYLAELQRELARVGIRGRLRRRILDEAADHLAEGEQAEFGDPRALAQLFADELATHETTKVAFVAFAALAAAGAAFAAAWLGIALQGWPDFGSGAFLPLGLLTGIAMLVCSQVAFAAGLLALLRAWRLRHTRAAPAAEIAVLARRTNTALACGATAVLAIGTFALDNHAAFARSYVLATVTGSLALVVPLAAAAFASRRAAAVRSGVPGGPGDLFDDLPVSLPRHAWRFCLAVAAVAALATFAAGGLDEGPRNAVAEGMLVVGCFAALGRRLGIRR